LPARSFLIIKYVIPSPSEENEHDPVHEKKQVVGRSCKRNAEPEYGINECEDELERKFDQKNKMILPVLTPVTSVVFQVVWVAHVIWFPFASANITEFVSTLADHVVATLSSFDDNAAFNALPIVQSVFHKPHFIICAFALMDLKEAV
jgi:hypothetical protein